MNMSVLHKKVNIKITIAILSLEVVAALLSLFLIVYPSINVKQVKAAGITYWVDVANGNDDNCTGLSQTPYVSGTNQACPFKTIQKAIGTDYISGATRIPPVVACGDIVNVKPGDYRTPAGTIKVNNVAIAINDSAHKPTLVNRNCVATSNFITIQAVNSQGARNPAVSDGGIAINGGLTANTSGITLTDGFVFSASSNIILDGFEITIPQDVAWNNGARGMGVGIFNGSNNITVKLIIYFSTPVLDLVLLLMDPITPLKTMI
ncbi:MAG: hypothetical protein NT094_02325 [Candidatus Staskawiczbacteria bacterium]|nr:hypothetical protein [Candidatus Staskawiczbacteria bacterium]